MDRRSRRRYGPASACCPDARLMPVSGTHLIDPHHASPPLGRVTSLDGLRGFASCTVAVFHFFYAFVPGPFRSWGREGFSVSDTPLAVLWNGHFSVAVFFALSGFVLAASAPRTLKEAPLLIGLRYFRLALPALAGSLIAWFWIAGFPEAGKAAQTLSGSSWFRWTHQPPIPPLWQAAWEGAVQVFVTTGKPLFDNPLWTMRIELMGSILIYGGYAVVRGPARVPALVAGLLGLAVAGNFSLAAFCGGALVFELRGWLRPMPVAGTLLALLGLVLGATYPGHADGPGLADAVLSRLGGAGWREAGALLVIIAFLTTPWLRDLFERPALQHLGALSFPLYLVHVPLIVGPAAWAFVHFAPMGVGGLALLFALTALAAFALASLFLVAVERPVLDGLHAVRKWGRARLAEG